MSALELTARWWDWIAPLAVQATLLGALALLVDRPALRRARPELVAAAWLVFFARLVLPPDLTSPVAVVPSALGAVAAPGGAGLRAAACAVWLAVSCALLVRGFLVTRRFRRALVLDFELPAALAREAELSRVRLGLRRTPRIAIAAELASPAVVGLLRPLVLVPRALASAPDPRARLDLRHALLHELAHVRRGDLVARALVAGLTACFWFHPLAWLGAARLARTRELLCDAAVADALGAGRASYRETLLRAARERLLQPGSVLAFHAGPSRILERLAHLERPPGHLARRKLAALALGVSAGCVLLPMASRQAELAAAARSVLAAEVRGENQSCFVLHAAALVLAAESPAVPDPSGE